MKAITAFLACSLLTWQSPACAKSVTKEFQEAWAVRSARYDRQASDAKDKLVVGQKQMQDASTEDAMREGLERSMSATFDLGYFNARSVVVHSVESFIKTKPSVVRAQLWIQEQIEQVKVQASVAREHAEAAKGNKIGVNGVTADSSIKALGTAMFEAGVVKGASEELAMMNQNFSIYYPAKNEQDQRKREAVAGVLAGIGQVGQNLAAESRAMLSRNWSATCSTAGDFTRCHGN